MYLHANGKLIEQRDELGPRCDGGLLPEHAARLHLLHDAGALESTLYIDYRQNPDGIDPSGGGAEISNIRSLGEAKDLALVLRTGALPVHLIRVR